MRAGAFEQQRAELLKEGGSLLLAAPVRLDLDGDFGRARGWAGELLHIKPILSIKKGEVLPVKRVRGNRKAFLEFASAFEADTRDSAALRVGIAHADAPDKADALAEMVRRTRPQAQLEILTELGPVVGAHAGPGTVGFFWFEDDDSAGS